MTWSSVGKVLATMEPLPLAFDGDVMSESYQGLQEALKLIATVEKSAYLEALERAPHLIDVESDPKRFLALERFNSFNAAVRLVTYWNERKKAFGDRTFLPLTLDGEGAFSNETLRVIQEGRTVMLLHDSAGRHAAITNQEYISSLSIENRKQLLFFVCFMTMNNSKSQEDGIVWLSRREKQSSFLVEFKALFHVFRIGFYVAFY